MCVFFCVECTTTKSLLSFSYFFCCFCSSHTVMRCECVYVQLYLLGLVYMNGKNSSILGFGFSSRENARDKSKSFCTCHIQQRTYFSFYQLPLAQKHAIHISHIYHIYATQYSICPYLQRDLSALELIQCRKIIIQAAMAQRSNWHSFLF